MKTKYFLALFGKNLSLSSQINEGKRHCFAPALSLETLKLVHRAIELPVRVSLVALKFVVGRAFVASVTSRVPSFPPDSYATPRLHGKDGASVRIGSASCSQGNSPRQPQTLGDQLSDCRSFESFERR